MKAAIHTTLAGMMLLSACVLGSAEPVEASADPWRTDFDAALATAREEGKEVLLDFTGTDWCVWCHRLEDEVFTKQAFLDYARERLVLVRLDFPRRTKLPAELQTQNDALSERFDVSGYPTVILLDGSGQEVGRLGYMQGGAKTFVRALKKFASDAKTAKQAGG